MYYCMGANVHRFFGIFSIEAGAKMVINLITTPRSSAAVGTSHRASFFKTCVEKQGSKEEKEEYCQMKLLDF